MAILALGVALQIASSCAPAVAPETWLSVVHTESGFDELAIGDNTTRQSYHPASLAAAVGLATQLAKAGHSLDLGAAQINTAAGHMQRRGLAISAAFDACTGFRVGGEVLTECWLRATGPVEQERLRAAIGCYNSGHPAAGTAYVQRVQASAEQIVPALRLIGAPPAPAADPSPPGPPPPPPCAPVWDAWALAECSARAPAHAPPPAVLPPAVTRTATVGSPHAD